jgi:hypothetical protein
MRCESRESTRAASAENTHQHRLDLIVSRMRRDDPRAESVRRPAQEAKSLLTPHRFEAARSRAPLSQSPHDHDETKAASNSFDVSCGSPRGRTRRMIERRDGSDPFARHRRHDAEQRHGIQPA